MAIGGSDNFYDASGFVIDKGALAFRGTGTTHGTSTPVWRANNFIDENPVSGLIEEIEDLTQRTLDLFEQGDELPIYLYTILRLRLQKARDIIEAGEELADMISNKLRRELSGDGDVHTSLG